METRLEHNLVIYKTNFYWIAINASIKIKTMEKWEIKENMYKISLFG